MSSEQNDSISNTDEAKGRIKEAAGAITDDDALKEEGRDDQRVGDAKATVDRFADKVKNTIDDVRSRIRGGDSADS